jgi:hypothetical protein
MGGTLANLRGHIEANGGHVIGASVLTGHPNGANIALQPATAQRLRETSAMTSTFLSQKSSASTAASSPKAKPRRSSQPGPLTASEIESLRQEAKQADAKMKDHFDRHPIKLK